MACEEDTYFDKVDKLGYAEYDDETIIGERVHNFVQLKSLNTVVALIEIGEIQYKVFGNKCCLYKETWRILKQSNIIT